jgi:hypothetical protein
MRIPALLFTFAGLMILFAAAIFWIFLRPASTQTNGGVITVKKFMDQRTIERMPPGVRREFWSPSRYNLPAGFLFTIRMDNSQPEARYFLDKQAASSFSVGDRVTVSYEVRGIPPLWSKRFMRAMTPQ